LLNAAEVALLGTPMPGAPTARAESSASAASAEAAAAKPQLPCSTCPGGRAGPGGAYAYSKPGDFLTATGRVPGVSIRRVLKLQREPVALTGLASRGSDGISNLGARIAAIVARISWPNTNADLPAVPLTPDERRRFDAGRELYANLCQACHQPDGRGQERIAPGLIDSPILLAAPDISARVLINGKEGPIGLMPPLGSTLSDEQVASVLTYARREWGHTASPVDPAVVAGVRDLTRSRTRPWRHDELMQMVGGK
jgi:mono/diheme cytochrome c family protein